ncbi:MAG: winged helix-turn-helix transcriptional regulator [Chthoniobacterales bacterium]|nr:winged helix-turn-helix transcriptional regulator [Chthoniobacterales bacterium]
MADDCSLTLPCDSVVGVWIRLLRAQRCTLVSVERALKGAGFPPLEWYDVLLELERAGPLRPRDLQARLLLAQSNLSRLLDRMESAGAIQRNNCKDDARGQLVCVSTKGTAVRKRMWPVYANAIQQEIGVKLSPAQAERLADLLDRLSGCAPPHD